MPQACAAASSRPVLCGFGGGGPVVVYVVLRTLVIVAIGALILGVRWYVSRR
jgi:uncharacterized membrane-anchored protein